MVAFKTPTMVYLKHMVFSSIQDGLTNIVSHVCSNMRFVLTQCNALRCQICSKLSENKCLLFILIYLYNSFSRSKMFSSPMDTTQNQFYLNPSVSTCLSKIHVYARIYFSALTLDVLESVYNQNSAYIFCVPL
jgi:hypothetical protein